MENEQWFSKNIQNVTMDLGPTADCSSNLHGHCDDNDSLGGGTKFGNHIEMNKRIEQVEAAISEVARKHIEDILIQVKALNPLECMLLYLKLPTEYSNATDPLRQPLNPLGSRSEISQTIMWIKTHLEEDPELSLPKQDVYNDYFVFCGPNKIKPLSTADFGKVMKQVYPRVRPRRLGTRGNSRYCYAGLRRRLKLDAPLLPDLYDKPQSSEITCTSTDLVTATWAIIKEWSEQQLEIQFPSSQALACYLVLNLSVGLGTEQAAIVSSAFKNSFSKYFLADLVQTVSNSTNKHRETQMQLQRKIQQKNEINKEQKRKMQLQSTKTEQKLRTKRCKIQNQSSIISSTNSISTSAPISDPINTNLSPIGTQTICDKSKDFDSLQLLPDFSSLQKAFTSDQQCDYPSEISSKNNNEENSSDYVPKTNSHAKVPIPRLNQNFNKFSPLTSPEKGKQPKYKEIQPKPEPCDTSPYNSDLTSEPVKLRSLELGDMSENYRKRLLMESFKPELMDVNIPLSRERLISISEIDKSALDDYLGASNSQEQEEELVKYFEQKDKTPDQDYTAKLAQLRNILLNQQNLSIEHAGQSGKMEAHQENTLNLSSLLNSNLSAFARSSIKNLVENSSGLNMPQHYQKDQLSLSLSARRKVTFDNIYHEGSVPPSPDTRRKNFNFTPISPGPTSPGEKYSKCSSANESPFVSPRSTPISRAKLSVNSNVSSSYAATGTGLFNIMHSRKHSIATKPIIKIKQETDTHNDSDMSPLDLPTYLPMSAPPSPKHFKTKNNNLLHKLLNSDNKVKYLPSYLQANSNNSNDALSCEISKFFSSNIQQIDVEPTYRSQSVPLHQMSFKSTLNSPIIQNAGTMFSFPTSSDISEVPIEEELNEFDQFSTDENIIHAIEDSNSRIGCDDLSLQPNVFNNIDLSINRHHINNSFEQSVPVNPLPHISNLRILARSQSIDVDMSNDINYNSKFPSRSVPGTPVPNYESKHYRSYPSTPILANPSLSYNHNEDYIVSSQSIKDLGHSNTVKQILPFFQNSECNGDLYGNDMYNISDPNIDSEIQFTDRSNFNFEGNLTDTHFNIKTRVANNEINGNDYHHKTSNIGN